MTEHEIRRAIEEGVRAAFSDPTTHCRYPISPEEHQRQHEAIEKFMRFTSRVDDLKWNTLKALIVWLVIGAFSLMMFGAVVKAKLFSIFTGG